MALRGDEPGKREGREERKSSQGHRAWEDSASWATLWERMFTGALTSRSLRSLGAEQPSQEGGDGVGRAAECVHTPPSHCAPGAGSGRVASCRAGLLET